MKLNLQPVITWLENGCDVNEAIKELKIYQRLLDSEHTITSLGITRAASFWYPTMLAQVSEEISESKAAELLGLGLIEYRTARYQAICAVLELIKNLPSPMVSLWEVVKNKSEFFND